MRILAREAAKRGISVVEVNPRDSFRTCSKCGNVGEEPRKNQVRFRCAACGWRGNADANTGAVLAFRAYRQQVDPTAVLGPPLAGGLGLTDNRFSGRILQELPLIENLRGLNLNNNQMVGEIPQDLALMKNLLDLNLSNNELSGGIPPELALLENLKNLNLSNNRLNGEMPRDLALLDNLVDLDVSNNQLSGELPLELTRLQNLKGLKINGNQLTGCIPSRLINQLAKQKDSRQLDRERSNMGDLPVC